MDTMTFTSDQLCALDELAVLHIRGADARSFMHSQLTNAVDDLTANQATLAGFCQAKGRLQATMLLWVDPANSQNLYALLHRSIAETVRKRLTLFLLRAKAELVISPARVYGLFNAPTDSFTLPATHYSTSHQADGNRTLIAAPNASSTLPARAWVIEYADDAGRERTPALDTQRWQAADIQAGLPWIEEASYETFLPQDINFDIIGGVSFKKGCFPGQEVVARLHYRTTAKRRAALGAIRTDTALAIAVGSDVFATEQGDRPIGRVINSAYDATTQQQVLLMEVSIDGITEKSLHALTAQGPEIHLQDLAFGWDIAKY